MIAVRGVLATLMIVLGALILLRLVATGLRWELLPGCVLGAAMIALGAHRISLMVRLRKRTG